MTLAGLWGGGSPLIFGQTNEPLANRHRARRKQVKYDFALIDCCLSRQSKFDPHKNNTCTGNQQILRSRLTKHHQEEPVS